MVSITICGKTIKNRTIWQLLIATIFMTCLAVIVPTLAIINNRLGLTRQTVYSHGIVDPGYVADSWDGAIVWANISQISSATFTAQIRFMVTPSGIYANRIGQGLSVFQDTVTMRCGSKSIKFDQNDILRTGDAFVPLIEGDPNQYPFDKYASDFVFGIRNSSGDPVPIAFGIVGSIQSWAVTTSVNDLSSSELLVSLNAKRNWIIKFFSIFVVITMWVLSLTILTLTATIWFRDRKVEPPIIGLCASLLFALPAVRNTQPDSPPIGMTLDVGGFFFNMAIIAFAAFLAMLNYIVRYRREKPKEAVKPLEQEPSFDEKAPLLPSEGVKVEKKLDDVSANDVTININEISKDQAVVDDTPTIISDKAPSEMHSDDTDASLSSKRDDPLSTQEESAVKEEMEPSKVKDLSIKVEEPVSQVVVDLNDAMKEEMVTVPVVVPDVEDQAVVAEEKVVEEKVVEEKIEEAQPLLEAETSVAGSSDSLSGNKGKRKNKKK